MNQFFNQMEANQARMNQQGFQQSQEPTGPWTCKSCGAQNSGRFCEYCGSPRG